jgi:AcrR family transcriptional regulator
VLRTAVELADRNGMDATSMRRIAEALDVTPMALYKHVADREAMLDGMVDLVVEEIDAADDAPADAEWRRRVRTRILTSRTVISRHEWARDAIETRTRSSPVVLSYMDSLMAMLRDGGFDFDLVHNAMHALSTRMWGFTREVFPTPELPADADAREEMLATYARLYPNIVAMAGAVHLAGGCDDQAEFEFALDILLDGFESARIAKLQNG